MPLSPEQVLTLATDGAAAAAGEGLARAAKWVALETDGTAVWGLCQGSGKNPYQVRTLPELVVHGCSCPSRKQPCKHILGLLLLWTRTPSSFVQASPPAFVAEWLAKREAKAAPKAVPETPEQVEKSARASARRAADKRKRWDEGLDEFARWMEDVATEGALARNVRDTDVWEERARRLNDAQLSGLAREARKLGSSLLAQSDWMPALAAGLGRLHLAVQAHRHRPPVGSPESWTPGMHADLDRFLGAAQREAGLTEETRVPDTWRCLGEVVEQEDRLIARRTWWHGVTGNRFALVWAFAAPGGPALPPSSRPPLAHRLTLGYFPSNCPLRAAVVDADWSLAAAPPLAGQTVAEAMDAACSRAAADPWTELFPMKVCGRLGRAGTAGSPDETWWVADVHGQALEIARPFDPFPWLARTAGHPATWFGEWDGARFRPLSVWPLEGSVFP